MQEIICYRKGSCGPYEMYSCYECPASKKEYLERYKNVQLQQRRNKRKINNRRSI